MQYLYTITLLVILFACNSNILLAQQTTITRTDIPDNDAVVFTAPEGYIDEQFKELAAKYIQPQAPSDLNEILKKDGKVTPEILQRLIDMISIKVSQQVRDDILLGLQETLEKQRTENILSPSLGSSSQQNSQRKKIIAGQKSSLNYDIDISPTPKKTPLKPILPIQKQVNNTINNLFIVGTQGSKVLINNASKKALQLDIAHSRNVSQIKTNVIMINTITKDSFVVKTLNITNNNKKQNTHIQFDFSAQNLPMGIYKLEVHVDFFNQNALISSDNIIWGSGSNNEFIIIKN